MSIPERELEHLIGQLPCGPADREEGGRCRRTGRTSAPDTPRRYRVSMYDRESKAIVPFDAVVAWAMW